MVSAIMHVKTAMISRPWMFASSILVRWKWEQNSPKQHWDKLHRWNIRKRLRRFFCAQRLSSCLPIFYTGVCSGLYRKLLYTPVCSSHFFHFWDKIAKSFKFNLYNNFNTLIAKISFQHKKSSNNPAKNAWSYKQQKLLYTHTACI